MVAFEPESFDIVFTSYGVLSWLPDLVQWASAVATLLKPSGVFYLVEFHPFLLRLVDSTAESTDPRTALSGIIFRQSLPGPACPQQPQAPPTPGQAVISPIRNRQYGPTMPTASTPLTIMFWPE